MGNSSSASETAGVKAQAEGSLKPIYSLLDLNGKYVHISHPIQSKGKNTNSSLKHNITFKEPFCIATLEIY